MLKYKNTNRAMPNKNCLKEIIATCSKTINKTANKIKIAEKYLCLFMF